MKLIFIFRVIALAIGLAMFTFGLLSKMFKTEVNSEKIYENTLIILGGIIILIMFIGILVRVLS